MSRLRAHIAGIALIALAVRVVALGFGFSTVCTCSCGGAKATVLAEHECCKRAQGEDTCPMHHGSASDGDSARPESSQHLQTAGPSCTCAHTLGLEALVGAAGVLAAAQHVDVVMALSGTVSTPDEANVEAALPVLSPPPRA